MGWLQGDAGETEEDRHTYITEISSFGLLNTSEPPSFHSPEGVINMALGRKLPWVEEAESFRKVRATWFRMSKGVTQTESDTLTEMRCSPQSS